MDLQTAVIYVASLSIFSSHRMVGADFHLLQDMVDRGYCGRKTKKGFFKYSGKREVNEGALDVIKKYKTARVEG